MAERPEEIEASIAEQREKIDRVDCEIVRLLNERAGYALAIRDLKPKVRWALYDPRREEEIFEKLSSCNEGPLYDDNLREIFDGILRVMKEM